MDSPTFVLQDDEIVDLTEGGSDDEFVGSAPTTELSNLRKRPATNGSGLLDEVRECCGKRIKT